MVRARNFVAGMVFGAVLASLAAGGRAPFVSARPQGPSPAAPQDSEELAKLYDADQADRTPKEGAAIDWAVVGPRDRQREDRVKALYQAGEIHTGKDYHRAAMILQHAREPEDYLLAHELCVVAVAKGERAARWLAAAAEDRFLMSIKRPQRFGTQFRSTGPDSPVRLYEVGPGVTDALRREMNVPTLAEARQREAQLNEPKKGKKPAPPKP
jgi:hypothetical protein